MAERSDESGAYAPRLLEAGEPEPFTVIRPEGASPFVFTADHASNRLPRALGSLGLSDRELRRHIAWDIGVGELASALSARLDAFAIVHGYSRLVIDVNRPLGSAQSIVTTSEGTLIPGNVDLTPEQSRLRAEALFEPYHARIASELDRRAGLGRPTVLVALHSFTPSYFGVARPWEVGVLYHRDARFAQSLRSALQQTFGLAVGDNQPYFVSDETDYGIPTHAERRGLPHVELEIRQDLLDDAQAVERWCALLATALPRAYEALLSTR